MIDIDVSGLNNYLEMLTAFPDKTKQAMAIAINRTAKRTAAKSIRDDMLQQVNLNKSYLIQNTPVKAFANKHNLVATITARDRPTMLSRFALNKTGAVKKGVGVRVQVKRGSSKYMKSAFMVDFSKGSGTNVGVVVRPKGGGVPHGVTKGGGKYLKNMNAWLLYAPSIDQLMNNTIGRHEKEIAKAVELEFLRQLSLKR